MVISQKYHKYIGRREGEMCVCESVHLCSVWKIILIFPHKKSILSKIEKLINRSPRFYLEIFYIYFIHIYVYIHIYFLHICIYIYIHMCVYTHKHTYIQPQYIYIFVAIIMGLHQTCLGQTFDSMPYWLCNLGQKLPNLYLSQFPVQKVGIASLQLPCMRNQ